MNYKTYMLFLICTLSIHSSVHTSGTISDLRNFTLRNALSTQKSDTVIKQIIYSQLDGLSHLLPDKDYSHWTPLCVAVWMDDLTSVSMLLDHGCDPNQENAAPSGHKHWSPLRIVAANLLSKNKQTAYKNSFKIAEALLTYGANPLIKDNQNNNFWDTIKSKKPFLTRLKKVHASYKNTIKDQPSIAQTAETPQESIVESDSNKRKPRKKKRKKKKKDTNLGTTETKKESIGSKISQTFRNVRTTGHAVVASLSGNIPTVVNQINIPRLRRGFNLSSHKKPALEDKRIEEASWQARYGLEMPYTITVFPLIQQEQFKELNFAHSLCTHAMYNHVIQDRLSCIPDLETRGIHQALKLTYQDTGLPQIFLVKHLLKDDHYAKYKQDFIAEKLDLLHVFDTTVDHYILTHGITNYIHDGMGKRVLHTAIPGKIEWSKSGKTHKIYGFFEYSFTNDSNTLDKCYHRFFRPLDTPGKYISKELQIALQNIKDYN